MTPKPTAPAFHTSPKLLELLVCPISKTLLEYDPVGQRLISVVRKRAYPIVKGIPIMVESQAQTLDPTSTALTFTALSQSS